MGEFGGGLRRNGGGMAAVRGDANAGPGARPGNSQARTPTLHGLRRRRRGWEWLEETHLTRPSPPAGRAERGNGRQPAVNGGREMWNGEWGGMQNEKWSEAEGKEF